MKENFKSYYGLVLALVALCLLDSCHSTKYATQSTGAFDDTFDSTYITAAPHTSPLPNKHTAKKPLLKRIDTAHEIEPRENPILTRYATKLEVSKGDLNNYPLYTFIDEWYGVAYKYGGKSHSGIDCSGFVSLLLKSVYNIDASGSVTDIYRACKHIKTTELKEGDLVFFKINKKSLSHVGIYLQNHKFAHASVHSGVVIDDLREDYYKKHFRAAGRILQ